MSFVWHFEVFLLFDLASEGILGSPRAWSLRGISRCVGFDCCCNGMEIGRIVRGLVCFARVASHVNPNLKVTRHKRLGISYALVPGRGILGPGGVFSSADFSGLPLTGFGRWSSEAGLESTFLFPTSRSLFGSKWFLRVSHSAPRH